MNDTPPTVSQSFPILSLVEDSVDQEETKHYPLPVANSVHALGGYVRHLPDALDLCPNIVACSQTTTMTTPTRTEPHFIVVDAPSVHNFTVFPNPFHAEPSDQEFWAELMAPNTPPKVPPHPPSAMAKVPLDPPRTPPKWSSFGDEEAWLAEDELDEEEIKHYPLPVANSVHALGGYVRHLPDALDSFARIVGREGVAFLFKPFGMDQLYRLFSSRRPVLLRRPFGWGIEMFAAVFAARITISPRIPFNIFSTLDCTPDSCIGLHQNTMLMLDFGRIKLDSESDFGAAFAEYVYSRCDAFSKRHGLDDPPEIQLFLPDPSPAAEIITYVAMPCNNPQPPLVLLIENFDIIETVAAQPVLDAFFSAIEDMVVAGVLHALVLFSDEGGDALLSSPRPAEQHSPDLGQERARIVLRHAIDVSRHPAFQTAVGCTTQDVRNLDDSLARSYPDAKGDIFEMLKDNNIEPVLFTDPNWERDMVLPLKKADLRVSDGDEVVYPLEPVMSVLTEKYGLAEKNLA
ncbi:hypothetical protein MKEN_00756900 [Mycena kentingensis (nom. inval.)]|nr:hypothetical protein MKEN_00756900 [Mycena kentingensis (nom. inval.)]